MKYTQKVLKYNDCIHFIPKINGYLANFQNTEWTKNNKKSFIQLTCFQFCMFDFNTLIFVLTNFNVLLILSIISYTFNLIYLI